LGLQSTRLCLSTNTSAIPGNVPNPPNFDLYEDDHHKMDLAVNLAESYAINVAPATVPEAAGRAMQSEVQADLFACKVAYLSTSCAVVALSTGTLLQLSLKVGSLGCSRADLSTAWFAEICTTQFWAERMLRNETPACCGTPSRAKHLLLHRVFCMFNVSIDRSIPSSSNMRHH
jgi:hypothetical protein